MKSLHEQVRVKAKFGVVKLEGLKPNSREFARRMVESGELIKSRCGKGFVLSRS